MSENTSFAMGEHFARFFEPQISEGRYGNASEVVRACLRLLEEREASFAAFRQTFVAGVETDVDNPSVPEILGAVGARASFP